MEVPILLFLLNFEHVSDDALKHNFRFLFLLYLKTENFIMLDGSELREDVNIAHNTSEMHELSEEIAAELSAILYFWNVYNH